MSDDTEHHDNAEGHYQHGTACHHHDCTRHDHCTRYDNHNCPECYNHDHTGCYDNGSKCVHDFHFIVRDDIAPDTAYLFRARPKFDYDYLIPAEYNIFPGLRHRPAQPEHNFDHYNFGPVDTNPAPQDRAEHEHSAGNWLRLFVDRLGFVRNFSKNR